MSECTHDCGSCSANCSERNKESLVAQPHKDSHIKKVIGVVSGKGGVGKSMVTSMSAVLMNRRGNRSAVLDADITGPSIPQAFGLHEKAQGSETEIFPVTTETGIKVMSVNLSEADLIAPLNSHKMDYYNGNSRMKTLDYSSGNPEHKRFAIIMKAGGENSRIIIEPDDEMAKAIKNSAPSKVFLD